MRVKFFLFGLFLLAFSCANAAKIDTISIRSESMNIDIQTVVVSPQKALGKKGENCPVIYLLHGYGGDAKSYVIEIPELTELADAYGVFFVCPDGKNNWYWDAPLDKTVLYETFTATELVKYIDANYRTLPLRNQRAITGLSMGGQGAFFLAIRHQDVFGAVGSMSGCVDICAFPDNWKISSLLGKYDDNSLVWNEYSVSNLVENLRNDDLKIIFDCGKDDFFYKINCDFHNKLDSLGIDHDFIVRPGIHEWDYWRNSIRYQVLFFSDWFRSEK